MTDMSPAHRIAWAHVTWDPLRGCSRKSAACVHCYAEQMTLENAAPGQWGHGFAAVTAEETGWTGRIELVEERLDLPLGLAQPRRIFVNALSDLFHDELPDAALDRVFAVMALASQHTFLVLTKRPKRMQTYLADPALPGRIGLLLAQRGIEAPPVWPLRHVWLGVTAENQKEAERRIPLLLATPAAVRFIAAEPLLGRLDLGAWLGGGGAGQAGAATTAKLDWVVAGGEDGREARTIQPDWVRSLRYQCTKARTAFFWNDWGSLVPPDQVVGGVAPDLRGRHLDGVLHEAYPSGPPA